MSNLRNTLQSGMTNKQKQKVKLSKVKNYNTELQKRKKMRKRIKVFAFMLCLIQIIFFLGVSIFVLKDYLFGLFCSLIFVFVNINCIMIRIHIIDNPIAPRNDPGITIWWLCCLKFGQKGKYLEKSKIREIKRNFFEL